MSPKQIVLDSYAFMVYLQKEPGWQVVYQMLEKADKGKVEVYLSIVNWGEIYYSVFRTNGRELAEESILLIDQLPIQLIEIDRALTHEASQFKSNYAVAYADCFAAALAQRHACPVMTGDKEFRKLEKEVNISWIK